MHTHIDTYIHICILEYIFEYIFKWMVENEKCATLFVFVTTLFSP